MKSNAFILSSLSAALALACSPAPPRRDHRDRDTQGGLRAFYNRLRRPSGLWHVTQNYPFSGSKALGFVQFETAGTTPNGDYDTGGTLDQSVFLTSPLAIPWPAPPS